MGHLLVISSRHSSTLEGAVIGVPAPNFEEDMSPVHWRRQLWGTGARAPLDFQLVILGITRFTDSDENVKKRDFCAIFINFWPIFVIFLPTVFLRE